MNQREIELFEKKSIYSLRVNNELKDSVINNYLNELNSVIKKETKRKELLVLVISV